MWRNASHIRGRVREDVSDSRDLTTGGHQEGDRGHCGDGEETSDT